jgi:predicted phosphodiesterase
MRYAVLSDVHGNLPALRAVCTDLETRQIDHVLYLGDAVGYYPDSVEVIKLLRALVEPHPIRRIIHNKEEKENLEPIPLWVAGNHEWGLLDRLSFESEANHIAAKTLALSRSEIEKSPDDMMGFLHQIPEQIEVRLGGGPHTLDVTLVHASPVDPVGVKEYITTLHSAEQAAKAAPTTPICLVGHTHVPLIFSETSSIFGTDWKRKRIVTTSDNGFDPSDHHLVATPFHLGDERMVLNPGSVGQPRDGNNNASYAVLDIEERTFTVYRVAYDVGEAQRLTRQWIDRIFPSTDSDMQKGIDFLIERLDIAVG